MKKIYAFIFARGGSKGLPSKNLLPINGKSLIKHSIEAAFKVPKIEKIIVSTDDEKIAEEALFAGALVPFIRPKELAQDSSPEWLAWQHAVRYFRDVGDNFDVFISLPATSPLRNENDIKCCLNAFLEVNADVIVTVKDADRNPYFNMLSKDGVGNMHRVIPSNFHRRQDAPIVYDMTTVAYITTPDFILTNNSIFDASNLRAVLIPGKRALDIDTKMDYDLAKYYFDSNDLNDDDARLI